MSPGSSRWCWGRQVWSQERGARVQGAQQGDTPKNGTACPRHVEAVWLCPLHIIRDGQAQLMGCWGRRKNVHPAFYTWWALKC